jgi:tRNA U34 5-methylaminomethyl-2-thiouridine-forming methyltransferase MnmC
MKLELKSTADGSFTLYLPEMDEQYHSLNGAVTESEHVFLKMGFNFHPSANPAVFEVGFGTGLNALLTAYQAEVTKRKVFYTAVENHPLSPELVEELDYGRFVPERGIELYRTIHECNWNVPIQITPCFSLLKLNADFTVSLQNLKLKSDIVYFDAFAPDKQPEMWTQQIFMELYDQLLPGGVLVTYSAKGEIRRRMNDAGFRTERLPGPPGKKEMLRGIK